jgi:hypothetical protein
MREYNGRYMDDGNESETAFIEAAAQPLRDSETLPRDFEARLMSQIRAESRRAAAHHPMVDWCTRPRALSLSPVAALAIAAGLAGLVAIGTLSATGAFRARGAARAALVERTPAAAAPDTVTLVRFVFVDPHAHNVALVGDFNDWRRGTTELHAGTRPGVWSVSVPLPAGRHEYAFIVDGTRWVADPSAAAQSDEFGTESSVLMIGSGRPAASSS